MYGGRLTPTNWYVSRSVGFDAILPNTHGGAVATPFASVFTVFEATLVLPPIPSGTSREPPPATTVHVTERFGSGAPVESRTTTWICDGSCVLANADWEFPATMASCVSGSAGGGTTGSS